MNNTQDYIEIDLVAYFNVIKSQKKKLLVFIIGGLLLANIYIFSKTPIYEVKSYVKIGTIANEKIIDPQELNKQLRFIYHLGDKRMVKDKTAPHVVAIIQNLKDLSFLTIKTQAQSNEKAKKVNQQVIDYIVSLTAAKIEHYILLKKNKIDNLHKQIKYVDLIETKNIKNKIRLLKTQKIVKDKELIKFLKDNKIKTIDDKIAYYSSKLKSYESSVADINQQQLRVNTQGEQSVAASIQVLNYQNLILNSHNRLEDLNLEKELVNNIKIKSLERNIDNIKNIQIPNLEEKIKVNLQDKKINLNRQIVNLEYFLSKNNVQNTEQTGTFVMNDHPIKRNKPLLLIWALFLSFILGIMWILFRDYLNGLKRS